MLTALLPSGEKHTFTSLKWAIPKKTENIKMKDKKQPIHAKKPPPNTNQMRFAARII
jgi:hypothetical protein